MPHRLGSDYVSLEIETAVGFLALERRKVDIEVAAEIFVLVGDREQPEDLRVAVPLGCTTHRGADALHRVVERAQPAEPGLTQASANPCVFVIRQARET